MLNEHIRRQTLKDPFMTEALVRRQPLCGVPLETLRNEVDKGVIRDVSQLHHYVF